MVVPRLYIFNESTDQESRIKVAAKIAEKAGFAFEAEHVGALKPGLERLLHGLLEYPSVPILLMIHQTDICFNDFRAAMKSAVKPVDGVETPMPEHIFVIFYSGVGADSIPDGAGPWYHSHVKILNRPFPRIAQEGNPEFEDLVRAARSVKSDGLGERFIDVNINEATRQTVPAQLYSLGMLIQGYLAIRAPTTVFGPRATELKTQNDILQRDLIDPLGRTVYGSEQRLFRIEYPDNGVSEATDTKDPLPEEEGYYWFDVCMPDVCARDWADLNVGNAHDKVEEATPLELVWRLLRECCHGVSDGFPLAIIETYLNSRYGESENRKTDPLVDPGDEHRLSEDSEEPMQRLWSCLFRDAHREYLTLFFGQLEQIRNNLNHNRIKQNFANKLMNHDRQLEYKSRYRRTLTAWRHIQTPGDSEDEEHELHASALESIDAWPSIRQEIENFFDTQTANWGLCLTEKGKAVRDRILDGRNSLVCRIDEFVESFESNAHKDVDEQRRVLSGFADALDSLQDALSDARYSKGSTKLFGGLFGFIGSEA